MLSNVSADLFWWVGEAAVYDVEGERPVLYLTSRERSPILTRPAEAAVALAKHHLLQALNPAQRRLAEALFGTPFERYLGWLRARGVHQTKVGALSPAGVVARYGVHGPYAMGARFSEVRGSHTRAWGRRTRG